MRLIRATSGRSRSWKNTPSLTPAAAHASISSSARRVVMSSGFSDSTCRPRRAAAIPCSACSPDGLPMATISIGRWARNALEIVVDRRAHAVRRASPCVPGSRRSTRRRLTPGIAAAARAWVSLMLPPPTMPMFIRGYFSVANFWCSVFMRAGSTGPLTIITRWRNVIDSPGAMVRFTSGCFGSNAFWPRLFAA